MTISHEMPKPKLRPYTAPPLNPRWCLKKVRRVIHSMHSHSFAPLKVRSALAGALADIPIIKNDHVRSVLNHGATCSEREREKRGGKRKKTWGDLRRTHSGRGASAGQGEQVVIVTVSRDLVPTVGVLRIGQEGILEPGDEFALRNTQPTLAQIPFRNALVKAQEEREEG